MSEQQPEPKRWRVEVIPTRRACVVVVEAPDGDAAIVTAQDVLDVVALLEGATWEVRPA